MSEEKMNFDHLEDGQLLASVSYWHSRLLENGDGVLSVCRKMAERIPELDDTLLMFESAKESIRTDMEALLHLLQIAVQQLPQKQGFFSSESDRKQGYFVSCRFLEALEKIESDLSSRDTVFLQIFSLLREREKAFLQVEAVLNPIRKAAKKQRMDSVLLVCQGYLDEIGRKREKATLFLKDARKIKVEIQSFCQRTVSDFCRRITVLADLEHEGKGGSPQGVLQLFGEIRHEVERIFSML